MQNLFHSVRHVTVTIAKCDSHLAYVCGTDMHNLYSLYPMVPHIYKHTAMAGVYSVMQLLANHDSWNECDNTILAMFFHIL